MQQPIPSKKSNNPKPKAQSKRGTRTETPPQQPHHQDAPQPDTPTDPRLVSQSGDLVLAVSRDYEDDSPPFLYRVESKRLRHASPYFTRLLDPDKFGEGARVAEQHSLLKSKYPNPAAVPFEELPHVQIAHLGSISPAVKSIQTLMADFLHVLHNQDLGVKLPPLANLANLAIVADRFDALDTLRDYVRSRRLMLALDAKKPEAEERVRQRLLVGLLLDNPTWVLQSSIRLIHKGWVGDRLQQQQQQQQDRRDDTSAPFALWWDLPQGIEHELLFRRRVILETIQSLQSHFLSLYTSRNRQCKLGYDSSPECDLYQLGQMVKFFTKIDTLSLERGGVIDIQDYDYDCDGDGGEQTEQSRQQWEEGAGAEAEESYKGDVFDLLDKFRQIPEYQIDKNHHHCGLRTRLLPLLDLLSHALSNPTDVGVCPQCWRDCRDSYAWARVKRPLSWSRDGGRGARQSSSPQTFARGLVAGGRGSDGGHLVAHLDARDLFLANEKMWTAGADEERRNTGVGWSHPNLLLLLASAFSSSRTHGASGCANPPSLNNSPNRRPHFCV